MENELKKELTDTMDDLKGHFELYVDLYKLKTAKRVSEIISKVLKAFIFISLTLIILMFSSFAMAFYLDSILEIHGIFFALMALFFLVVFICLWMFRRVLLEQPTIKSVINLFFANK